MNFLKTVIHRIFDFLLPPLCPICQKKTLSIDDLCPDCYQKIHFISKPYCSICGRPFYIKTFGENTCADCLKTKPTYHKARASFLYDDFSKKLILPFKHADKIEHLPLLVNLLNQAGKELFPETDIVIPIPLHRLRLLKRRYNQAALLAQKLAHKHHKIYMPDNLIRIRATKSQGHLKSTERKKNIRKAFHVKYPAEIKGKNILLIDDVLTTGATVNECCRTLLKAGAKSVSVLTLARVLKHTS